MENYHISEVKRSLVRPIVLGNMPAKWMWSNFGCCLFLFLFIAFKINMMVSFFVIPFGFLSHILLLKGYVFDPMLFSVYSRHMMQNDYIPASSRAHFVQNNYKGM